MQQRAGAIQLPADIMQVLRAVALEQLRMLQRGPVPAYLLSTFLQQ
jgi:hypothetical protein